MMLRGHKYQAGNDVSMFEELVMRTMKPNTAAVFNEFVLLSMYCFNHNVKYAAFGAAKLNFKQLEEKTGLSQTQVRYAVKKLEARGLVKKVDEGPITYRCITDYFRYENAKQIRKVKAVSENKDGPEYQAYILAKIRECKRQLNKIEKAVKATQYIEELTITDFMYPNPLANLDGKI